MRRLYLYAPADDGRIETTLRQIVAAARGRATSA
jgi:hypothetical protein